MTKPAASLSRRTQTMTDRDDALERVRAQLQYAERYDDDLAAVEVADLLTILARLEAAEAERDRLAQQLRGRDELHAIQSEENRTYQREVPTLNARAEAQSQAVAGLVEAVRPLVAACDAEFAGPEMASEPDDDPVAYPSSLLTFGMIRRARQALAALEAGNGSVGISPSEMPSRAADTDREPVGSEASASRPNNNKEGA